MCRRFSLVRCIAYQAKLTTEKPDLEQEVSDEMCLRTGKSTPGFLAPYDVFDVPARELNLEERAASQISSTAPSGGVGGNLIATDFLTGQFVNLLRSKMLLPGLGARMLTGLVGKVEIPRQESASTAYWVAEDADLTMSAITFRTFSMVPHHVGLLTQISRNMLLQTTPDVEMLVRADFAAVLARAIDNNAILGSSGGDNPNGLISRVSIQDYETDSGANAAGELTYEDLLAMRLLIYLKDANFTGWVTNPNVVAKLQRTLRSSADTASNFIMGDSPGRLLGHRVRQSTVVPNNFKKGTRTTAPKAGANLSTLLGGDWSEIIIGTWAGFEILTNPYAEDAYKSGAVQIRAMATMDTQVRRAEHFVYCKDVVTV